MLNGTGLPSWEKGMVICMIVVYGIFCVLGLMILIVSFQKKYLLVIPETKGRKSIQNIKWIPGIVGKMLYQHFWHWTQKQYRGGRRMGNPLADREKKVAEELSLLHPGKEKGEQAISYIEQTIGEVFLILWFGSMLAFVIALQGVLIQEEHTEQILRKTQQEGSYEELLLAECEGQEQEVRFLVEPRVYTEEETAELYESFLVSLEKELLGGNVSVNEVRLPLHLVNRVEGYPFSVEWELDQQGIILSDGKLDTSELGEQGAVSVLCAKIRYESFWREYEFALHILPPVYTREEQLLRALQKAVEEKAKEERTRESFLLPKQVAGETVLWKKPKEDGSFFLFLLAGVAGILLFYGREQERKKQLDQRTKCLEDQYPELVVRMALLLGAGMTVKAAFQKMAEEGEDVWGMLAGELQSACREMDAGIAEGQAYLHFGNRCQKKEYKKLATLLTQNIKKGSKGLLSQLLQEAHEALEDKKSHARRLGEEAGTKLLLPMTGMLIVTMLIIMVPAFGSFGI